MNAGRFRLVVGDGWLGGCLHARSMNQNGLQSFPILQWLLRGIHAHPDYAETRIGLKASVFVVISLPAVYTILLTIIDAIMQPSVLQSGNSLLLIFSPWIVLNIVLRTIIPIFAYIFLIEYVQRTDHFDEYVTETTALNPAVPGNVSRFGRRLEIIFLIFIFPFYTMIEVLGVLLTADYEDGFEILYTFFVVISTPLQIGVTTMAVLVICLLAFLHILDAGNYVSMLPATDITDAVEQYDRLNRAIRRTSKKTEAFMAVLIIVSALLFVLQVVHAVMTGTAIIGLTTMIFYILMVVMALRLAAWVTDRAQYAVDEFFDEHGKAPSNEVVVFFTRV